MSSDANSTIADGVTVEGAGVEGPRRALMVYHRDGLQVVPLVDGVPVVLGRTPPSDLRFRSRRLSRQHARFVLRGDDVLVEDLGSTNGTMLNGERISGPRRVGLGDEVTLGSLTVTVHGLDEAWLRPLGLDGHERFLAELQAELARARTFERGVAVAMFRPLEAAGSLPAWVPRLQERLRLVDRAALFGPDCVEVLLPEAGLSEARALAEDVLRHTAGFSLGAGVAAAAGATTTAEQLIEAARLALSAATPESPVQAPSAVSAALPLLDDDGGPIVRDPAMQQLYDTVDRVARSMISVLVVGETGTGKEVIAQQIHERSERREGPLRVINCGAIPATLTESILFGHEKGAFTGADQRRTGVFEEARGGTILLDEIGELSLAAQVALLRVLETRRVQRVGSTRELPVDVRVIAATHRDLQGMCETGDFRWDLLYRLNPITLRVPPLRQRSAEIRPLVARFMRESNRINGRSVRGITPDALSRLERWHWPGNVRELKNTVDRAVVIAATDVIGVDDLPERMREDDEPSLTGEIPVAPEPIAEALDALDLKACVQAHEEDLIKGALYATANNQSRAAELLSIPRRTLVYKLKAYDIRRGDPDIPAPDPVYDETGEPLSFRDRVARFERALVEQALARAGGDPGTAARLLNVQRRTLLQKIERYGLS